MSTGYKHLSQSNLGKEGNKFQGLPGYWYVMSFRVRHQAEYDSNRRGKSTCNQRRHIRTCGSEETCGIQHSVLELG